MIRRVWSYRCCRIVVALSAGLAGCNGIGKDLDPEGDWPMVKNPYPWTVLAMSFSDAPASRLMQPTVPPVIQGRDRRQRAANLVRHLRANEGLEAFYSHATGPKKQWSAVFVGGYETPDSGAAQNDLAKTKRVIRNLFGATPPTRTSRLDRYMEKEFVYRPKVMIVANTEVVEPGGRPAARDVAPPAFNRGPYSIYTCPGRYTLRVKVVAGAHTIWFAGQAQPTMPSMLREAEGAVEAVAEYLRKHGHDAYTWHSRRASAVCVGSFDHPKDPQVQRVRAQLSKMRIPLKREGRDAVVVLDEKGRLMHVPKQQ